MVRSFGLAFPEAEFKLIADNRDVFHVQPEPLESRIDAMLDPTYSRNLLPLNINKGDILKSEKIEVVILSSSANSKFLGAYLSGITDSSYVSNVIISLN